MSRVHDWKFHDEIPQLRDNNRRHGSAQTTVKRMGNVSPKNIQTCIEGTTKEVVGAKSATRYKSKPYLLKVPTQTPTQQ